jgi:hypothetical protein
MHYNEHRARESHSCGPMCEDDEEMRHRYRVGPYKFRNTLDLKVGQCRRM